MLIITHLVDLARSTKQKLKNPEIILIMGDLSFYHLNIRKSIRAANLLSVDLGKFNIDFVSIKEPYVYDNVVYGFPKNYSVIYKNIGAKCVILIKSTYKFVKLFIHEDILAVRLNISGLNFIFITVYFHPDSDFTQDMKKLEDILIKYHNDTLIICGDFNAKNRTWGSGEIDAGGSMLLNLIIKHDMIILNDPKSPPTFVGPNGHSWVDVTIVKNLDPNKVQNWKVLEDFNLSDHRTISFTIGNSLKYVTKTESHIPLY